MWTEKVKILHFHCARSSVLKAVTVIYLHGISQTWLPGKVVKADDSPKLRFWQALLKSQDKIPMRKYRAQIWVKTVGIFLTCKLTLYVGAVLQSPEDYANSTAVDYYHKTPVVPMRHESGVVRQCLRWCLMCSNRTQSSWTAYFNGTLGPSRANRRNKSQLFKRRGLPGYR